LRRGRGRGLSNILKKSLIPFARSAKTRNLELFSTLGVSMAIDRRAEAYAEQHYPIFLSRYIAAAKAGRADIIPEPIRDPITAYATGRTPRSNVNPGKWMKEALYEYRVRNGRDFPLPPEMDSAGKAAAKGALKGASIGLGIATSLLRLMR
jgi:hypothetical protein